ncbi:hypothetical protein LHJ74_20060 [Streptomyces sp. N2-109]|uniref:Uncharacterized protein n=1 Tax=Streptomyces gossypii TaxID=2883101 RepID=A0ABT2JWF7_9ACTN|nr:hypothetical protein [Streptomyces gossypii]MCT2592171.1 hypothetical protein [Streptomyces gossypii]
MSNIFTDFIRVYADPRDKTWGAERIGETEAEWITWMLLGRNGSYHVPVYTRRHSGGEYVDVQYGGGKSPDIVGFCELPYYHAIWGRHYDEGSCEDVIWRDDVNDGPRSYCRYGFDEVRVIGAGDSPPMAPQEPWQRHSDGSWRLGVAGSYRTGNDRSADVGSSASPTTPMGGGMGDDEERGIKQDGLPTPTTPNYFGNEQVGMDPPWLAPLGTFEQPPGVALVEFYWRGRRVHRARLEDGPDGRDWEHRCADDWDNCIDADFLRFTGETSLLAPDKVYERDRRDWGRRRRW